MVALTVGLILAAAANAGETVSMAKLGKKIEPLALKDATGKPFSLAQLNDKKAVVVVFLSFECPISTSYCQPLADLARSFDKRGVAFVGISTNDDLTTEQLAKHVRDAKLPFPVLRDEQHRGADAFQAEVTPEAFVLDGSLTLRYRGRIDNAYAARLKKNSQISRHDLREALEELLAGKSVTEPATLAVGCAIPRETTVTAKSGGAVTYYRHVLPILQDNCQICHRPGEVGPFSLMIYRQAVNWASDIKDFTQSRKMPPWKPTESIAFHNERKLTEKEIATVAAWVDSGTPEGDPKDAPAPKAFPEGWRLGKPDLVLTMDNDFQIGPTGRDHFRCIVLPTNLTEDKFVVAIELRPGNPRIVHHTLLFIDTTGQGRELAKKQHERLKKEDTDQGPGYTVGMGGIGFRASGGLGGWAPGQLPRFLPEGAGFLLPKGSDVIMQMHYHRNGRAEKDRTTLGLYFAKKPVSHRFQSMVIPGGGQLPFLLNIPANNDSYQVQGTVWVGQDCQLHTIMPHMHLLGKKIKVTMTLPEGKPQTLVGIDDWDYNWQETYLLKQPLAIKAGTRFEVEAVYDNSSRNPNNPNNPPKNVRFGEQTTNRCASSSWE